MFSIGKNIFSWGKIDFWTYWEFGAYRRSLALANAQNFYIDYLMFYPSRQRVKWKYFKYKFIFKNDFMVNGQIYIKFPVFSVIKNDFGHALVCWWEILYVRVNYAVKL